MENKHEKAILKNALMFNSLITHIKLNHRACVLAKTFYGVGYNKTEAGKYEHGVGRSEVITMACSRLKTIRVTGSEATE